MLINFIYMFQIIYKRLKCKIKFVRSAFIHKEFCMQKNKVKAFICCFSIMSEKNQCGINWKSSTIKTFLFQTHFKHDPKGLNVFTLAHKVKNCVFICQAKIAYIVLDTPLSFRMAFATKIL